MELHSLAAREEPSNSWAADEPIVIDLGSYHTRAGMASASAPAHAFPSFSSKNRERGGNGTQLAVGYEALEHATKANLRPVFDQGTVANWDALEHVLDYSFELLGVSSDGFVNSPLCLSEQMASPHSGRATISEILFEGYGVPKLKTCVDAVAAFNQPENSQAQAEAYGVHMGNEAVHITPFLDGKAQLSRVRRLNWGGRHAAEFMQQLLALKYPSFPTRLTLPQSSQIFERCCFVSQDYRRDLAHFLDIDGLEGRERIIQMPVPADKQEPSREQLEAQAERRKESGRRLQEQARRAREEKTARLTRELDTLKEIRKDGNWDDHFPTEEALSTAIARLSRTLKLDPESEQEPPPVTPLLDVPDKELDPEQIKEKRKQKLLRVNYDSRMKIRAEKLARTEEIKKAEKEDQEWRDRDLQDWIKTKRDELFQIRDALKEKQKIRQQLNDRRSLASKMRMKSIVMLASGEGVKKRKIKNGDNFGADDADWQVYNNAMDDEDDEDSEARMRMLQAALLEHDPDFSLDLMHEQIDWRKSTIHKFLYGAHPFSTDSPEQIHQLNINIERIRVPEVLFQPMINGVDQAGLAEILDSMSSGSKAPYICLSGGLAQLPGLGSRLVQELASTLPCNTPISIHKSSTPILDAWHGMAAQAFAAEGYVTKEEYDERGFFVKPHSLGNFY